MARCLAAGPTALLSHRTAAAIWRLDGFSRVPFEVLVPTGDHIASRPGLRVHRSAVVSPADRALAADLPVTAVPRTLIDLGAVTHPERVDRAFDDALVRHLCTIEQVVDRFVALARRGRPGIATMRALLEQRTGEYVPTHSAFEQKVAQMLDAAGLPAPARQHPVALSDRTVFLDLAWPRHLVALECDGVFAHARDTRLPWDDDRQNQLVLLGWIVLRVTWRQLQTSSAQLVQQVRGALLGRQVA